MIPRTPPKLLELRIELEELQAMQRIKIEEARAGAIQRLKFLIDRQERKLCGE